LSIAADSPDQKREKVRKMATQTLADLYKLQPDARAAIQKSAGYAVFSNLGVNLLVLSTAHGSGLAVNSKTNHETFMKMLSAGVGLGAGVKDSRVIFAFETEQALAKFVDSGWEASGQADAAAKAGSTGGAYSGRLRLHPVCGCIRSPRTVSLCRRPCRARSTQRTTISTNRSPGQT
jgi:lipid-binding SYLF domain-containing protein